MNEPVIKTEEQIISLFPDRETQVCRSWVLKRREGLPEQYGRLGFRRAYLYRCYQKKQEEKSSKE